MENLSTLSTVVGCNDTSHDPTGGAHHGSAEETSIFGIASHLTASQLFLGFFIVSLILAFSGEGLNILEEFTKGTTYHLMLQRIYREIMMMGLMSFGLNLILLAGLYFPHDLMIAFEFGDLTLFMTSIHFCLQGLWVMFVSIGLGNAWDRASKITSEELQIDVERSNESSRVWKRMFYPFSVTRNQVEFRIFQSIFSSAYSISTKHTELDFGLFLKMTHENNLLHIIDFDITKWALILILIGLASIKVQFYHSACDNPICEAEEEIWIFTCCGVVILLLSILLFYWGRKSELLLIQKSGVESIDDYQVFLMVESQMHAQFEKNVLKTSNVKTAINELMVEAESNKLEAESKKRRERKESVGKLSAKLGPIFDGGRRMSQTMNTATLENGGNEPHGTETFHLPHDDGKRKNSFIASLPAVLSPKDSGSIELPSTKDDVEFGTVSDDPILDTPLTALPFHTATATKRMYNRGISGEGFMITTEEAENEKSEDPPSKQFKDMEKSISVKTFREVKKILTGQGKQNNSFRNSSSVYTAGENEILYAPPPLVTTPSAMMAAQTATSVFEQQHPLQDEKREDDEVPRRGKSVSGNITSSVQKAFGQMLGSKPIHPSPHPLHQEDSVTEKRSQFKAKMKTHIRKQNYLDVFIFHNPLLFYSLISIVMACNSLYLALWTTNFAIIANRGDDKGHIAMLVILSILPALFALPFVSQAIKSSSILKAVTKLNLDVVSSVVEKTENRIKVLGDLRSKLTHYLERESQVSVLQSGINWLYERYNNSDGCGLTKEEFSELLEGCRIHYPAHKCRTIFTALDINRDGFISMEEFERFLFPEATLANDLKKRKFFDAKNSKMLGGLGKHAAAKKILAFLDTKRTLQTGEEGGGGAMTDSSPV